MTLSRHLVSSFEISPVLLLNTLPNLQLCGSTFFAQHNKAFSQCVPGYARMISVGYKVIITVYRPSSTVRSTFAECSGFAGVILSFN